MGSPTVDPPAVALDDQAERPSSGRAADRALLALVVAVLVSWIAALAYTAYTYLI